MNVHKLIPPSEETVDPLGELAAGLGPVLADYRRLQRDLVGLRAGVIGLHDKLIAGARSYRKQERLARKLAAAVIEAVNEH